MNQADADSRTNLASVDFLRHLGKALANPLGHLNRFVAVGIDQHGGKFLAAEPADEIRPARRLARCIGEKFQHAITERVAKAVID